MHKSMIAAVALAALSLPGCVFAIGTDDDWDDGEYSDCCTDCSQMEHCQKRLNVIEHHLKGDCKTDCPFCKAGRRAHV